METDFVGHYVMKGDKKEWVEPYGRYTFSISPDLEISDFLRVVLEYFDIKTEKEAHYGIFNEDGDEVKASGKDPPAFRRLERQIEFI